METVRDGSPFNLQGDYSKLHLSPIHRPKQPEEASIDASPVTLPMTDSARLLPDQIETLLSLPWSETEPINHMHIGASKRVAQRRWLLRTIQQVRQNQLTQQEEYMRFQQSQKRVPSPAQSEGGGDNTVAFADPEADEYGYTPELLGIDHRDISCIEEVFGEGFARKLRALALVNERTLNEHRLGSGSGSYHFLLQNRNNAKMLKRKTRQTSMPVTRLMQQSQRRKDFWELDYNGEPRRVR